MSTSIDFHDHLEKPAFTLYREYIEICKGDYRAATVIPYFEYYYKENPHRIFSITELADYGSLFLVEVLLNHRWTC